MIHSCVVAGSMGVFVPNEGSNDPSHKDPAPKGKTGAGSRRRGKFRWFAARQNLQFEIDAVQAELDWLKKLKNGPGSTRCQGKEARECCDKLLQKAKGAFRVWFPRELIVWQCLCLIRQNVLFALPFDQLAAKWETIQRRLKALEERDSGYWGTEQFRDWVLARLKGDEQEGYDAELRSKLREARKLVDDKVTVQMWAAISLRRNTVAASIGTTFTSAALIVMFACEIAASACPVEISEGSWFSPITMLLSGILGAHLSILFVRPKTKPKSKPAPSLVNITFVRPVIGGAAGLFLFLVLSAGILKFETNQWISSALAIILGFSERGFYGALSSLVRKAEESVAAEGI